MKAKVLVLILIVMTAPSTAPAAGNCADFLSMLWQQTKPLSPEAKQIQEIKQNQYFDTAMKNLNQDTPTVAAALPKNPFDF